jgi:hypothetical protein
LMKVMFHLFRKSHPSFCTASVWEEVEEHIIWKETSVICNSCFYPASCTSLGK